MPLDLDKRCKERLIEALSDALTKIDVDNGMFLNSRSCFEALRSVEAILPATGKLRDRLVSLVDDFPLLEFAQGVLDVELYELDSFNSDIPVSKLTDINGYTDPRATARRLIDNFDSLPWTYRFSTPLPSQLADTLRQVGNKIQLSDSMWLVAMSEEAATEFPLDHRDPARQKRVHSSGGLASYMLLPRSQAWPKDSLCLQIQTEGYVDRYGTTLPAAKASSTLRAFLGLGIALDLFARRSHHVLQKHLVNSFVHRRDDDLWQIETKVEWDQDTSMAVQDLAMDTWNGRLEPSRQVAWASFRLDDIRRVFSAGETGERIVLASRWLFDSYHGRDELLRFVQTMVALEILLGDSSERLGVGDLLRNRCAYLIAKSQNERDEIMDVFNQIYTVRSQIVHRGKSRLTAHERGLFGQLRHLCSRVIKAEVDLLPGGRRNS